MPYPNIKDLLTQNSYGQDLYNFLQNKKSMPTVSVIPLGVDGEYFPSSNHINLSLNSGLDALFHETTHAADRQLQKQYENRPMSWGEPTVITPFTDAYIKLREGKVGKLQARNSLAKLLNEKWYEDNINYRSTSSELAGWAGGRTVDPVRQYKAPDHLDSTIATEMSILMDLAKRADTPYKEQPSWFNTLFFK